MKKLLALILLCSSLVLAQIPTDRVDLQADPPPATTSVQASSSTRGVGNFYYWVVTRYVAGDSTPAGPAVAAQVATPSVATPVRVSWTGMTGAQSYTVLRNTVNTSPLGAGNTCAACGIATGVTGTTFLDNIGALFPFTATPANTATGFMRLDNRDFATPTFVFSPTLSSTTAPITKEFIAGLCQGTTAASAFNLEAASVPAGNCVTGTNTVYLELLFDDTTTECVQDHFRLPATALTNLQADFTFRAANAGTLQWTIATVCVSAGETGDPAYGTAVTVTPGATGSQQWNTSGNIQPSLTGCTTLDNFFFEVCRAGGVGTLSGDAGFLSAFFTLSF